MIWSQNPPMECRKKYLCIDETKHSNILGHICNILKMKNWNKQIQIHTHIYIYLYLYIYVSPQKKFAGRIAKKCKSPEKKIYIHSSRITSCTCTKPKNEYYYACLSKEYRSIVIHPYTLHIFKVCDKSFFSSWLLLSPFLFLFFFDSKCGPLSQNSWNQMVVATRHNLLCWLFLIGPMGRIDTSQLVHACHRPLSCFSTQSNDKNVYLPLFLDMFKINSVVSLLRFTAYWDAKSDYNWLAHIIWQNYVALGCMHFFDIEWMMLQKNSQIVGMLQRDS